MGMDGNGMIKTCFCGSFPRSLLSTSKFLGGDPQKLATWTVERFLKMGFDQKLCLFGLPERGFPMILPIETGSVNGGTDELSWKGKPL